MGSPTGFFVALFPARPVREVVWWGSARVGSATLGCVPGFRWAEIIPVEPALARTSEGIVMAASCLLRLGSGVGVVVVWVRFLRVFFGVRPRAVGVASVVR